MSPREALALSARDLAGSGTGFGDVSLDGTAPPASGALSGGILGSLSGPSAAPPSTVRPDVRLNPVPDRPGGPGMPAARPTAAPTVGPVLSVPSLGPPRPVAVPTPRLRPVPDTLPVPSSTRPVTTPPPPPSAAPAAPVRSTQSTRPSGSGTGSPAPAASAPPADPDSPAPTLIRADELQYDRDLGAYRARGNVELSDGPRVVMAETVVYNERSDTLTANGNVRVVEADGTTYFANYVELSSDLKDGFVRDMSVLLADRSRIAAVYATRTAGERKDFWKGVYTACDTCPTEQGSPWPTLSGNTEGTRERMRPLWQLRAAHVTHDEVARDIIYRDATLELFGIPVAYTPYLRQPDPTVYRRTGLLSPIFGVDDQLGFWTEVPYYVVLDDQQDATLGVRGMSEEGWLLHPEYRLRFADGTLALNGSLTDDGDEGLTGHLKSEGRWHINDVWRAGFDSHVAGYDGYLDRYDFVRPTWLTNHAWVEAFSARSHAALEGFAYLDTRTDHDDDETPLVLPLASYDYVSEPGILGGMALLDGSVQSVHREEGATSTRVSGSVGWKRPGELSWGLAYDAEARLHGDVYAVEDANVTDGVPGSGYDGSVVRVHPSARLRLRYPMVRTGTSHRQILEPLVTVAAAPPGLNTRRIPNEDSQDPQLSIANLFTGDRTAGRDRVDDGVSVNYGLRWTYAHDTGGTVSATFGQAWRAFESSFFPSSAGYGDGFSDFVGGLDIRPIPALNLFHRFRLDRDDLSPNTSVLGFQAGTPILNVGGTYVIARDLDTEDDDLPRREEIVASIGSAVSRYWSTYAGARYNLETDQTVDLWGTLNYEDECLIFALDYSRSYNEVDGEEKGESLVFRVTLKTLGEISF